MRGFDEHALEAYYEIEGSDLLSRLNREVEELKEERSKMKNAIEPP